jgi:protein TonB
VVNLTTLAAIFMLSAQPAPAEPPEDRDAVPVHRVQPRYPADAMARAITGTCHVRFTVGADGSPTDIEPLDCHSLLADSSVRAIEQWRYLPKIVDGVAVDRPGVETALVFQIQDY